MIRKLKSGANKTNTRLVEFFEELKGHRWQEAKGFREFEGRYNAAEVIALRCVSGPLVVLITRSPAELMELSSILAYEVLNDADSNELDTQIEGDKWRSV